jgi:hypothetical protein
MNTIDLWHFTTKPSKLHILNPLGYYIIEVTLEILSSYMHLVGYDVLPSHGVRPS